jgi:hypothetical protein
MITQETITEIKHKLSELGHGSKKQLARHLHINQAQVSLLLRIGFITPKKEGALLKWLNDKPVLSKTEDDNN